MKNQRVGRREFLKATVASAAAAGLSHFRILNYGGTGAALARTCEPGDTGDPDTCDVNSTDWCIPGGAAAGDPDICPDTSPIGTDMCPDDSGAPQPGADYCDPMGPQPDVCAPAVDEPDQFCIPLNDPDVCVGDSPGHPGSGDVCLPPSEPDVCRPSADEPDGGMVPGLCDPNIVPDFCIPGQDPDACEPAAAPPEPDLCAPALNDPDVCIDDAGGDDDVCGDPFTDPPDVCSPTFDPDVCQPPTGPADEPSPVTLSEASADAGPASLPAVGAVVAALGAAMLWLRRRLGRDEPEPG